MHSIKEY